MTEKEQQLLKNYSIFVSGNEDVIQCLETELRLLGFNKITILSPGQKLPKDNKEVLLIEFIYSERSQSSEWLPVIYVFDFIKGAGAMVVLPGDNSELVHKQDLRKKMAEYMVGYCAFWNLRDYNWLDEALPLIYDGITGTESIKTAAYMCGRIAAGIATGRYVKHFPRFYLSKNSH